MNAGRNRVSSKNAASKRRAINAAKANYENEAYDVPVICTVTHYRKRKCDTDAPVVKWLIDCIVASGILKDDSIEEIKEIRHKFIIGSDDEKTVVEITPCED